MHKGFHATQRRWSVNDDKLLLLVPCRQPLYDGWSVPCRRLRDQHQVMGHQYGPWSHHHQHQSKSLTDRPLLEDSPRAATLTSGEDGAHQRRTGSSQDQRTHPRHRRDQPKFRPFGPNLRTYRQ